jgi:hypothetical protein
MKVRFLLVLERLGSILKRCRPKSFYAGPPPPLDLAFPWISITGKEMLTHFKSLLEKFEKMGYKENLSMGVGK